MKYLTVIFISILVVCTGNINMFPQQNQTTETNLKNLSSATVSPQIILRLSSSKPQRTSVLSAMPHGLAMRPVRCGAARSGLDRKSFAKTALSDPSQWNSVSRGQKWRAPPVGGHVPTAPAPTQRDIAGAAQDTRQASLQVGGITTEGWKGRLWRVCAKEPQPDQQDPAAGKHRDARARRSCCQTPAGPLTVAPRRWYLRGGGGPCGLFL